MLSIKTLVDALSIQARHVMESIARRVKEQGYLQVTPWHLCAALLSEEHHAQQEIVSDEAMAIYHKRLNAIQKQLQSQAKGTGQRPVMSGELIDILHQAYQASYAQTEPPGKVMITQEQLCCIALLWLDRQAQITTRTSQKHAEQTNPIIPDSLAGFLLDLTAQAELGALDPVIGRDKDIGQLIDILLRRRQNNPILVGDPGVGKTAIVEGLALRIHQRTVPQALAAARLFVLDVGGLQAGASAKGEFEHRLKAVIECVRQHTKPVILFVDEAHTLIGAGGQPGTSDAANLLKPALARGELRMIAATTWSEYKQYFEKDAALTRRFELVKVNEPSISVAVDMLTGVASLLSNHHGVRIHPEAVQAAVELSARYLHGRFLPDKAISLLDTACARAALIQSGHCGELQQLQGRLAVSLLRRKLAERSGLTPPDQLQAMRDQETQLTDSMVVAANTQQATQTCLSELNVAWQSWDQSLLAAPYSVTPQQDYQLHRQKALTVAPSAGEVDREQIATIITEWTGIPIGQLQAHEHLILRSLGSTLERSVKGQTEALTRIASELLIASCGLGRRNKPRAVFLLTGPSGTGKTQTAYALANALFGSERQLFRLSLSEFQEAHSVASLRGAPPGYVGYGRGGILTEAVRHMPYSLILLDEAEKAHPDVLELFYQVFDRGQLDDAEGRTVDFSNTVIVVTSNVGDQVLEQLGRSVMTDQESDLNERLELITPDLLRAFKAPLLGRMIGIPFKPLDRSAVQAITQQRIDELCTQLQSEWGCELVVNQSVVTALADRALAHPTGARHIEQQLSENIMALIVNHLPLEQGMLQVDCTGEVITLTPVTSLAA